MSVEDRTSGVSASDVIVGKEAKLQGVRRAVLILSIVFLRQQFPHNRLCLVIRVLVALIHLRHDALRVGVVVGEMSSHLVSPYLSVGKTHGEVGVAVVGHVLFHAYLSSTQLALLITNVLSVLSIGKLQHGDAAHQVGTQLHCRVLVEAFLVDEELHSRGQELCLSVHLIDIEVIVVAVLLADISVYWRQIFLWYLLSEVLQHRTGELLVEFYVPLVIVVLEDNILLLLVSVRVYRLHGATGKLYGTSEELRTVPEALRPVVECTAYRIALGIEVLELFEVDLLRNV